MWSSWQLHALHLYIQTQIALKWGKSIAIYKHRNDHKTDIQINVHSIRSISGKSTELEKKKNSEIPPKYRVQDSDFYIGV